MSPIDNALSRLEKVRQRQPGQWSARCPAHADQGPSLSVRETPEGSVLIHCFAGCSVIEIVAAMGLELNDLFPPRDKSASALKKIANLLTAGQALELLRNESWIIAVAAANTARGVQLNDADRKRLLTAAGRVNFLLDETRGTHA